MTNLTLGELDISSELARSNLQGQPLRVAAVISLEYAYDTDIVENPDGTVLFRESFAVELLRALELTMNFTTIAVITKSWGHRLPNGTWVGMIPLLLDDEADLGLSSIADLPFRREAVDFNIPTNEIRLSCFFQRPSAVSSHYSALSKPFHSSVWIATLILLIAMITTAIILNRVLNLSQLEFLTSRRQHTVSYNYCQITKEWIRNLLDPTIKNVTVLDSSSSRDPWTVSDCAMWSFTAMSLRGFYKSPMENSLRITMIAGSFAGVLLYAAYSGTLVSFLSVTIEPINNLVQLLATDFTFVVVDYELPLKFLSESPDAKGVAVFRRRRTDTSYNNMKEAYPEINKGSFVFVTDHAGAYEALTTDFTTLEACRVREIEIEYGRQKQGTLVQKRSKYKRIVDYQILKTIQFGLVKRWSTKFFKRKPLCDATSIYEGVDFLSSSLAFGILLIFGWIWGLFGLLLEIWVYRRSNTEVIVPNLY